MSLTLLLAALLACLPLHRRVRIFFYKTIWRVILICRRRSFQAELELVVNNPDVLYMPKPSDLYINVQQRNPVRAYIALNLDRMWVYHQTSGTFIRFPRNLAIPLNNMACPHMTLIYPHQSSFPNYTEFHVSTINMQAVFRSLSGQPMWGRLELSGDGNVLAIGRNSELYALARVLQRHAPFGQVHDRLHLSLAH
jgi:hypothetical protein